MHTSKLKNIYNSKKTNDNWENYKKQLNFCVNLLQKTKKQIFQNIKIRNLKDKKKFWKTIKLHFVNKELNSNRPFLKEKGDIISNEKQLASVMNNFFIKITKDLELKEDNSSNANILEDVLKVFNSHPSVERIRRNIKISEKNFFNK